MATRLARSPMAWIVAVKSRSMDRRMYSCRSSGDWMSSPAVAGSVGVVLEQRGAAAAQGAIGVELHAVDPQACGGARPDRAAHEFRELFLAADVADHAQVEPALALALLQYLDALDGCAHLVHAGQSEPVHLGHAEPEGLFDLFGGRFRRSRR